MKCDEDILKVFKLQKRTQLNYKMYYFKFQKTIPPKLGNRELGSLHSACCLLLDKIDSLNGFKLQRGHNSSFFQFQRAINPKNRKSRDTDFVICTLSNID